LLNYVKVAPEVIIDDNELKQGLFTPGMSSPIVPAKFLDSLGNAPVAFLILSWNFFDEVKRRIKEHRDFPGDAFIHPGHILSSIQASPPCLRASDVDFCE
jgi:hypothetical protein